VIELPISSTAAWRVLIFRGKGRNVGGKPDERRGEQPVFGGERGRLRATALKWGLGRRGALDWKRKEFHPRVWGMGGGGGNEHILLMLRMCYKKMGGKT